MVAPQSGGNGSESVRQSDTTWKWRQQPKRRGRSHVYLARLAASDGGERRRQVERRLIVVHGGALSPDVATDRRAAAPEIQKASRGESDPLERPHMEVRAGPGIGHGGDRGRLGGA